MYILIADQHPKVRSVVKKSVRLIYPEAIFSEAEDGASTLLLLSKENFQLAIIEDDLPILSGIDVLDKYTSNKRSDTQFILISAKHKFDNYLKGIKLGVKVYINTGHLEHEIERGITAIKHDGIHLSARLSEELKTINGFAEKVTILSRKERIFLSELKEGLSIEEISDKLVISNRSVNLITANICEVIDIPKNQTSLKDWAISHKHYFK